MGKSFASTNFYQQGTSDLGALIARVQAARPSLVAADTIGADGQNFLRQWAEAGGGAGLTGRIFTDQIPAEILESGGLNGLTAVHPYDVRIDSEANKVFVANYPTAFGSVPNLTSWVSYEDIKVIAEAIRVAGSADPAKLRSNSGLLPVRFYQIRSPAGRVTKGIAVIDPWGSSGNKCAWLDGIRSRPLWAAAALLI